MTTADGPAGGAMEVAASPPDQTAPPLRVLRPSRGWRAVRVREVWAYRELFYVLATRDVRVRYRQTVLGATWAILQPFLSMVVFSVVFGTFGDMPSDGFPYPVFVYAGMLPWQLFATTLSRSANSMLNAGHLISKVYFPRIIVPLASVGVALVDFAVSALVLLGLMLYFDVAFGWRLLLVPGLLFGVLLCAVGVGSMLSGTAVRYRDFQYVIPFAIQLWMYASPVIYPPTIFPEEGRWLVFLNPMAGYIDSLRGAFLGRPIDTDAVALAFALSAVCFVAGAAVFARLERHVADVL